MPTPTRQAAVFLSYAREDADAARRIAEALRADSIEAWFDQNELQGGEAWDQKIRHQIRTCALLLPVVSANTQQRGEGYFRREWKFAAERTHDMAAGIPFLVPVVIDDTAEATALVPEEFLRVQWTRLPDGHATPGFVAQVRRLLDAPRGAVRSAATAATPTANSPSVPPPVSRAGVASRRFPSMVWVVSLITLLVGLSVLYFAREKHRPARPGGTSPEKSVAVLPFASFSTDKADEALADGVHDDVINNLQKIHDLTVIWRTSVLAYRDPAARHLAQIAEELGVAHVVEGSVRRVGQRVRVTAKLISTRTEASLWSDTVEGDYGDIFTLQATLATRIATALQATLTANERTLIARRPTQNQQAYEAHLRARVLHDGLNTRSNLAQYEHVIALYESALTHDPDFALVHARLAEVHAMMHFLGTLDPSPARRAKAERAFAAAERLAPGAPETLAARGALVYYCEHDWTRSLALMRQAAASLPNDTQLLARIAYACRRTGQWSDAIDALKRATELNPHDLYCSTQLLQTQFMCRRYAAALTVAEPYSIRNPTDGYMREYLLRIRYAMDGDRAKFLRERASLPPQGNDPHGLRAAYENALLAGNFAAALRVLQDPRLESLPSIENSIAEPKELHRALLEFLRGNADQARAAADEAVEVFARRQWMPRQETMRLTGLARAAAFAGRADEAFAHAREALNRVAGWDRFLEPAVQLEIVRVYAALGRRDEAMALLQKLMHNPVHFSAHELRHDHLLVRLKEDPRFEEILRTAKSL